MGEQALVKRGTEFTHPSMLDPDWMPGPGQRYADAPKARCVVTTVRRGTVWFRYATDPDASPGTFTARADAVTAWLSATPERAPEHP